MFIIYYLLNYKEGLPPLNTSASPPSSCSGVNWYGWKDPNRAANGRTFTCDSSGKYYLPAPGGYCPGDLKNIGNKCIEKTQPPSNPLPSNNSNINNKISCNILNKNDCLINIGKCDWNTHLYQCSNKHNCYDITNNISCNQQQYCSWNISNNTCDTKMIR
jgi:hypothetical protein